MNDKFFNELKKKAQRFMESGGSHEFSHVERVYNLAIRIAKKEKEIDMDIIKAAALLHDIARTKEDKRKVKCHAEEGARIARKILEKSNFPQDKIKDVCYAIKIHRYSKNIKAKTKEAGILQDADRLDALGAITIGRMFSTGGKIGIPLYKPGIPFGKIKKGYSSDSTIHGFHTRILPIKPEKFNTKEARIIAKHRYGFVKQFLDEFMNEWEGKR